MRRAAAALMVLLPAAALADPPEVVDAARDGGRLSVTLRHADTGWDHYADAWEVLDAEGNSLGLRELAHPHVDEQPFTRSLAADLPAGEVLIRARCTVTGWSEPVAFTLD
ncbi:hypothetical protein HKCCE2091_14375 [Rhodobacterales bacterium HKCCE2091]|nr:hypothetical protein [Rhodobacterales bacterium HKCCE2091]